jgi:hypothetical protein
VTQVDLVPAESNCKVEGFSVGLTSLHWLRRLAEKHYGPGELRHPLQVVLILTSNLGEQWRIPAIKAEDNTDVSADGDHRPSGAKALGDLRLVVLAVVQGRIGLVLGHACGDFAHGDAVCPAQGIQPQHHAPMVHRPPADIELLDVGPVRAMQTVGLEDEGSPAVAGHRRWICWRS